MNVALSPVISTLYSIYCLYSRLGVLHEAAPVIIVLAPAVGHLLLLHRILPAPGDKCFIKINQMLKFSIYNLTIN